MSWTKHDIKFDHEDGRITRLFMQTDGDRYVLSEHPENRGPHVSTMATQYGDAAIKNNMEVDPSRRPEQLRLYVERPDGRFDQWDAKTTMYQNVATEPNRQERKATAWDWGNRIQHDHSSLQQQLGVRLEQGGTERGKELYAEHQAQELRDTALPKTDKSEELRQAAREQQSRTHKR